MGAMGFATVFLLLSALVSWRSMSMALDGPERRGDRMIFTTLPSELAEVDYVLAGGGTAGSIIAARLSDAHPSASILVIEAGPESFDVPSVAYPALYRNNITPTSTTLKFTFAAPEPQLANRSMTMITGATLGGGSAVNLLMYARGQRPDYDGWEAKGWSANDLIPLLKKSETYAPHLGGPSHGHDGPIDVSSGKYTGPTLQKDFISSFNKIGYPTVPDLQDLSTGNGVGPTYRIVSPDSGRRQDTAYTYLYPRLKPTKCRKLSVLVGTRVLRVLFDGHKRATGVEIQTGSNAVQTINAKKLVVASAGALGTPQLLEMSGVGDSKVLAAAGVSVVSDLPGVGADYENHEMILNTYRADLPVSQNVDSVVNGQFNTTELIEKDADILSWNGVDASAKIRPTSEEVATFSPALRKLWHDQYAHVPSKPLGVVVAYAGVMDFMTQYPAGDRYFTLAAYNPYPRSRGHIHITGPGIDDAVDFKTGILSDADNTDVEILTWLYKKQRSVAKRMPCQRGQVSTGPAFAADSVATNDIAMDAATADDPTYSAADDEAIDQWIRQTVSTPFHSLGTCKMAARSANGVVDSNLSVYGVKGLKVADLSIPPGNVAGNTMNAAVVIGEKAADIIIKEH